MKSAKRNFKDSLFVHMFGKNANAKRYFLSLYNALHDTNFKINEVAIKPVTLSNAVYTGLENDVAMQIDDAIIVLIEQQSTINENMPFRCLEYVTALYSSMFKSEEKYKKKKLLFPRPEFYVFYNGREFYPAQKELRLSDSYISENQKKLPQANLLDLVVKVINLNSEENVPLLKKCLPLESYAKFVHYVIIGKENGEENYVSKALERCIDENLLPDYFSQIAMEEQTMIFGEYSYEDDIRVQRKEAFEDGISQGIAQGISQGIAQGISQGIARQRAEDEKVISEQAAEIQQLKQQLASMNENSRKI